LKIDKCTKLNNNLCISINLISI